MDTLRIDETLDFGVDQGHGNLLGVQPFMLPQDYTSQASFTAKLEGYLRAAQQKNWLAPNTVVVFPEYIGTWLAVTGEKSLERILSAPDLATAMRLLATSHPVAYARRFFSAPEKDRAAASLFRMQAESMTRIYQAAFSQLAQTFQVTLVAGSLVLPDPHIQDGQLLPGTGPLYNTSAVFRPNGSLHPLLTRKAYPTADELSFIMPARVDEIPVYETPAGTLGVLICADSWYPAPYQQLKNQAVQLIAVPSFSEGMDSWNQPWGGYNGAAAPTVVDLKDVNTLTEGQAWRKYALSGRLSSAAAVYGVNVFLHGALWNLGSNSGQSILVHAGSVRETVSQAGALLNLWLD